MKYLKIQNDGILDIRLVALMGGTTKSNDQYKIGQFGSGLKYTLAWLFRNNIDFHIYAGSEEVKVGIETEIIMGEPFEIICINGNRTSITTKMGMDWKPWMICRELWCNALDEGGSLKEITSELSGEDGKTTFYIQIDTQIQEVLDTWDTYFIQNKTPMWQSENYSIYPGGQSLRLYKNGVLIHEDKERPSLFSYDIKRADINELREFRGIVGWEVYYALEKSDAKIAQYYLENISDKYYEGDMSYSWYGSEWSNAWKEVIGNAKLIHQEAYDRIMGSGTTMDDGKLIKVPKKVYEHLTKFFPGIGALRAADKLSEFYENYDEKIENRVKQALAVLETCEYVMHPELEFVYGFFENKDTMAKVNMNERRVYISQTMFNKPLFDIIAMLIEENEHYNTGYTDESRKFQQHFIDLYTRELLSKNEVEI